jgi:hypothetical protein
MRSIGRLAIAGVLALAACSSDGATITPGSPFMFRGVARVALEDFSLLMCGGTERWSVDLDSLEKREVKNWEEAAQYLWSGPMCPDGGAPSSCRPMLKEAYLEATGVLSDAGKYGHLGKYTREVRLVEVVRASPQIPGNCPQSLQ